MVPRWPIVGRQAELAVFEAALASGEHAGLLIHGRAGVGKTRLADECRQLAAAAGHPTERVFGSRSTAEVPLGAVAVLLTGELSRPGPDGQLDTAALFEQSRRALYQGHGGRRLVIVADDVPLLDSASLALLGYLAAQGTIFLIATVRNGEPVPDLVTGLWREGRLERVDLADLSRADLGTLLHLALGDPVEAGTSREFWRITGGNPLYVRELVLGCLESGGLVERAGVWHLEGPVPSTARLADLVGQRIDGLSAAARSVVELLALCQPLELEYLEAATPAGVLESLERAGLVTIATAEGEVRLAHPLHGTVVRAAMPKFRGRAILLAQAARLEAAGRAGPAALRIAVWRLDAGGQPDPAVLVRGAHLARYAHDFRTVARLIEAVPDADLDAAGTLLLGEALYELGDFGAAERVLARGQQLPASEHIALRLAVTRAKNAQWGLCEPERALAINAAARRWPAVLKASAAADAASAASSMAPSASKSPAAPVSSCASRARAPACRARADTNGESHMRARSRSRAEVSSPLVRIRSCSSHASAVRCPVAAACAAASRNRRAAAAGRPDAWAVHASASCCSGPRKPKAGPVSRSASAWAAASASPRSACASARPDRARRRGPAKRCAWASPAASA